MKMRYALASVAAAAALLGQPKPAAPQDPNVLAAKDHIERRDYVKAAAALELAIKMNPGGNPEVYAMLALSRLNLNDVRGAAAACDAGLAAFPRTAPLLRYCGDLYAGVLPPAEAVPRLEAALARAPSMVALKRALGKALVGANAKDPRCGELLAAAVKAMPRDPETRFLYGQWACLTQSDQRCLHAMRAALPVLPAHNDLALLQAYTLIAMAQERLGQYRAADSSFRSALSANRRLARPNPAPMFEYARFLSARSRDAEAGQLLDEVLRIAPAHGPARFEKAKLLFRAGQAQQAAEQAELALQSPGDKVQLRAIHAFLVRAYGVLNRPDRARAHREWVEANR